MGATCQEIHTLGGTWYRVNRGDTLGSIAARFNVGTQKLAEINDLTDPNQLKAGQRVFIPKKRRYYASKGRKTKSRSAGRSEVVLEPGRFVWPVKGKVTSRYGIRGRRRHDGIDISVKRGTPVKAAASGKVIFSSRLRGYGNLILVKHKDGFFTAYGHNARNLKKKGEKVKRGEVIARVGTTGRTSGPHLHFEVRKENEARNPLFFLPKEGSVVAQRGVPTGGP